MRDKTFFDTQDNGVGKPNTGDSTRPAIDRGTFLKSMALAGAGVALGSGPLMAGSTRAEPATIGIIGLDISHAPAFTRIIHEEMNGAAAGGHPGFRVTAAYPRGSYTIESSYSRIPQYKENMRAMGVEIVNSEQELLDRVDYVMLLTNDGTRRLEQALQVIEAGKPMFMDKPMAASLSDTIAIIDALREHNLPAFTSSSLRFIRYAHEVRHENLIGDLLGVEAYSPALREPSHPDLFWYGIHGVETLFAVLGTGCESVARTESERSDVVVGHWSEGRLGTFRGLLAGRRGDGGIAYGSDEGSPPTDISTTDAYGGVAYGAEAVQVLGPYAGYGPLVESIVEFYRTGTPPVTLEETLEIYAFMEAADESKRRGGESVTLDEVIQTARSQR